MADAEWFTGDVKKIQNIFAVGMNFFLSGRVKESVAARSGDFRMSCPAFSIMLGAFMILAFLTLTFFRLLLRRQRMIPARVIATRSA